MGSTTNNSVKSETKSNLKKSWTTKEHSELLSGHIKSQEVTGTFESNNENTLRILEDATNPIPMDLEVQKSN